MIPDAGWRSLREIDSELGLTKGSAFRAFKQTAAEWQEGRDFVVLDTEHDDATLRPLRDAGRLYASSVKVILLAPAFAAAVRARLQSVPQ